ncbi:hypothetical protein L227DRAFT_597437 [Lentinus tigrinus ALCF2SS1-6]|uniref:Mid2 domain-containing protein n=1 Tax=Lentinus tigrinus ALCF2SS1-6 TaxID=1328759 RepID=A0A5C2SQK9_9APHY|nr:hypothetical protein L227DRAFT_597437 [Lentinus tigrinus ALCF2SS1-6]
MYLCLSFPATVAFTVRTYAQTTNAPCKNGSDYNWSYNSLGQSPCLIGAYMMGACQPGGSYDVQALPDVSFWYNGPAADQATLCSCSSISYSLLSACGFCQGAGWPEWSLWTQNCPSQLVSNGSYPHPIPKGTRIPLWAFVPIAGFLDEFDAVQGMDIGDKLESNGIAAPTGTPTTSGNVGSNGGSSIIPTTNGVGSTGVGKPSDTSVSSADDHSTNVAAVIGGIIAGLIVFALVAGIVIYFCILRKRRKPTSSSAGLPGMVQAQQPGYDTRPLVNYDAPSTPGVNASDPFSVTPTSVPNQWAATPTSESAAVVPTPSPSPPVAPSTPPIQYAKTPPMRLYDPSDPTTFPPTLAPAPQASLFDMTQVTYPNVPQQTQHPIPEL